MYNLCCISNELKDNGYSFQTMTWKRYNELCRMATEEYALAQLGDRWLNNLVVTRATINHCRYNGWGYRLSSDLFPILTHPDFKYGVHDVPQWELIETLFKAISKENTGSQIVRLSMHPDQFNVLASDNQESVNKTIKELNVHGWIMDSMGCVRGYANPMNIHVNCTKGNLKDIADRFMSNLNQCDQSVTSRLVVENEDKGCWNVENLLAHFNLPITYDNLHDKCNPSPNIDDPMTQCDITWNCKPIFHYSESHPDKTNPRSHADTPLDIPPVECYDWDIELKAKDRAIRMLSLIELTQEAQELGFYNDKIL